MRWDMRDTRNRGGLKKNIHTFLVMRWSYEAR
jgi:hypothetical protein